MSNFLKRFLTSLVILPIVFYSVYKGEIVFTIFVGIVLSLAYWELEKMLELPEKKLSIVSFFLLLILVFFSFTNPQMFLYSAALIFVIWIIRIIFNKTKIESFWNSYLFILLYVGFGVNFSILIRNLDNGIVLLASVLIISSINDIAAYIVGKFFGVTKAFPNVSPNKTYEGSIAGIISSIVVSIFLFEYFQLMIPLSQAMFIGMVISFLGILGDLLESFIKRKSGVKDTGTLLPGHGGVLDRIDSLIVILPFFYFIIKYLGY
ncbi:phosphatidate cytidylyltransferase [bacterium]|nr:phosphatidate cytidylyltransferase [bacterium]|tara:strand:+ start:2465 stop:3253 length:789 start_codon:yes stop_codon:yes gene_type:complete